MVVSAQQQHGRSGHRHAQRLGDGLWSKHFSRERARVENDRGDISQVHVDPEFTVSWENLDDGVAKVFYLVEASVVVADSSPSSVRLRFPAGVENNSYVRAEWDDWRVPAEAAALDGIQPGSP